MVCGVNIILLHVAQALGSFFFFHGRSFFYDTTLVGTGCRQGASIALIA